MMQNGRQKGCPTVGECQVVVNRFVQVEAVRQNMLGGHMGERAAEIELGDFACFKIILRILGVNAVDFADKAFGFLGGGFLLHG
jgi:hypothetical protein